MSMGILIAGLWCSFKVPLGELTFAQHMDRIGQTPEAEALLHGTRSAVSPMLEEATQRLLGEYIEAPTRDMMEENALRQRADVPKARHALRSGRNANVDPSIR